MSVASSLPREADHLQCRITGSMIFADARGIVAGAFARIFERQELLPVSEWSDAHAWFKDASGAILRWRTANAPFLKEIMDACQTPGVTRVTFKKREQIGGTEALQRVIQCAIDQAPTRIMVIYPNEEVARKQVRLKLLPALKQTPRTASRMAAARKNQQAMLLQFDRTEVMLTGSNSPSNVEGFACGLVIVDELDRCDPATLERIEGRGSALAVSLIIAVGTPGQADMGIDAEFKKSDQRRYMVPCPHCGVYDYRKLENVRWPGLDKQGTKTELSRDILAPIYEVERGAVIVCEHCKGAIDHSHNLWQLRLGVWVPKGCDVGPLTFATGVGQEKMGAGSPQPRKAKRKDQRKDEGQDRWGLEAPHPASKEKKGTPIVPSVVGVPAVPDHRGYELTGLYRCFPHGVNPYGKIARDFVEARGNPSPEWWNRRMGLAHAASGETAEVKHLKQACVAADKGGFRFRTVPPWAVALVACGDVQANHAWLQVMALGPGDDPDGQACALIDFERVECPAGSGLAPVEAFLNRTWPVAGGDAGQTMGIGGRALDSGHRTDEVYQWARLGGLRRALKGTGGLGGRGGMAALTRWSSIDVDSKGRAIPGGLQLLLVNTWAWKVAAVSMLQRSGGVTSNSDHALAGTMRLFLPEATPMEWMLQATAEQLITTRRHGKISKSWSLKVGRADNHAFDTTVYFLAYCHAMNAVNLRRVVAGMAAKPTGLVKSGSMVG